MGMDQMITVPCHRDTGAMRTDALEELVEREIKKGSTPFYVNTMAGTTVMGSFDNQNEVADIAAKYNLWHHVDACWSGFLAFSETQKAAYLPGIERVSSITINPHKGFRVPIQCSVLVTNKKKDALRKANNSGATYLFHETEYSKYDLADKTLSCSRRGDSFKLWMQI